MVSAEEVFTAPAREPLPAARMPLVASLAAAGVAAVAYLVAVLVNRPPPAPASILLFAAAPLCAAVALAVLSARARSDRDDLLGWAAAGLAVAVPAMVLQVVSFPLAAPGGGVLSTSGDGSAALYVLFHLALSGAAIAGGTEAPPRWRRPAVVGGWVLALLFALDAFPLPALLHPDGAFTGALLALEVAAAVLAGVSVVVWARRVGFEPNPLRGWVGVALSLNFYDLVLNVLAGRRFTAVWWASLGFRVATYAVLAVAAVATLLLQFRRLERYTGTALDRTEARLQESLDVTRRLLDSANALARAASPGEVAGVVVSAALSLTRLPRAAVFVLAEDQTRLRALTTAGFDEETRRRVERLPLDRSLPATRALVEGAAVWLDSREQILADYPAVVDFPALRHAECLAAVPLAVAGVPLAVFTVSGDRPRGWSVAERHVLLGLAAQAGQALQRARLYERQRATAEMLQSGLLPRRLPDTPHADLTARYLPGAEGLEIGGDWYDVVPVTAGRLALVVGDVMGKGAQAAALMGEIRSAVRVLAAIDPHPAAVLSGLDGLATDLDEDEIVTLAYVLIDPATGTGSVALAGHPPPLLLPADGAARLLPEQDGPPLGVPVSQRAEAALRLDPGDSLVLYSDGLVEDRRADLDDRLAALTAAAGRLAAAARPPAAPQDSLSLERLVDDLVAELASGPLADDVTVLAVRRTPRHGPAAEEPRLSLSLQPRSEEVGRARSFAADALPRLAPHLLPEQTDAILLSVSELVTNAIVHARSAVEVRLSRRGGLLRLEVQDRGTDRGAPERRDADLLAGGGRGLALVSALASDWGFHEAEGTVVWAEFPVSVAAGGATAALAGPGAGGSRPPEQVWRSAGPAR